MQQILKIVGGAKRYAVNRLEPARQCHGVQMDNGFSDSSDSPNDIPIHWKMTQANVFLDMSYPDYTDVHAMAGE
jgi:hypothetical protein